MAPSPGGWVETSSVGGRRPVHPEGYSEQPEQGGRPATGGEGWVLQGDGSSYSYFETTALASFTWRSDRSCPSRETPSAPVQSPLGGPIPRLLTPASVSVAVLRPLPPQSRTADTPKRRPSLGWLSRSSLGPSRFSLRRGIVRALHSTAISSADAGPRVNTGREAEERLTQRRIRAAHGHHQTRERYGDVGRHQEARDGSFRGL